MGDHQQRQLGEWEKHTKGIGLKLLNKFGFKGRLGANEDGVSSSIEVKVRPNAMGLGFGDFKEASAMKSNKVLEAEWRKDPSIIPTEEEEVVQDDNKPFIEALASSQSWKIGSHSTIINKESLQEETPSSIEILDMRGPTTKVLTNLTQDSLKNYDDSAYSQNFGVGKELLYNVSMMSDMCNQECMKVKNSMKTADTKLEAARKELEGLDTSLTGQGGHLDSIRNLKVIVDAIINGECSDNTNERDVYDTTVEMLTNFTEELPVFGLHYILFNRLSSSISRRFSRWEPLDTEIPRIDWWQDWRDVSLDKSIVNEIDSLFRWKCEDECSNKLMRAISVKWDVRDPTSLISIFEGLQDVFTESKLSILLNDFVMLRLKNEVNTWDPTKDMMPIHVWLHPWLPLLRGKLASLYPDIRYKLAKALKGWRADDLSAYSILRPWHTVFDRGSMNNFLLKTIVPKLLQYAETVNFTGDNRGMDELRNVMIWSDILPNPNFLAIIGGEFLSRWQNHIFHMVRNQEYESAAEFYILFRQTCTFEITTNYLVLNILESTLDLMRKAQQKGNIDDFTPNYKSYKEFLWVLNVDNDTKSNFQSIKRNSRKSQSITASFKDVVESFAEKHGICFVPKQGRLYEGKQLWQFGSVNIYIENDVAFWSSSNSSFEPATLDELLEIALKNED